MSIPVVAVVGSSNSGKTTLVCALVSRLTQLGYSVGVAKHAPHGHDVGPENVDSNRIAAAGATRVAVVSPGVTSRMDRIDGDADEACASLFEWARGCDLLLLEGWKTAGFPKIVVGSSDGLGIAPPVFAEVEGGDGYSEEEIGTLVRKIVDHMIEAQDDQSNITLRIDGEEIRLKRFPSAALAGIVKGYLETLAGVPPNWKTLDLNIERE